MIREDRIVRHQHRVHNDGAPISTGNPEPFQEPELAVRRWSRSPRINTQTVELTLTQGRENTIQPSFEQRFGDKNLGYVAREQGRYGSIPFYDDYGDESDAE
jgi:hypothetical protein